MLYALLVYGCEVLFASPTCTPWGNNSRGWPKAKLRQERAAEGLTLQFLTVLCFLQVLLGRTYTIENPKGSDIDKESMVQHLKAHGLPWNVNSLDQCGYGATIDDGPIKKSTSLMSDQVLPELTGRCTGDHVHVHLRGTSSKGSRTALSAVYPDALCDAILSAATRVRSVSFAPPLSSFLRPT